MKNSIIMQLNKIYKQINDTVVAGSEIGLYLFNKSMVNERERQSVELKSGRVYLIKGVKHRASAQNESSAKLTGKKNRKTDFRVNNLRSKFGVDVSVGYAPEIEKSRKDSVRAYQKKKDNLKKDIIKGIQVAMDRRKG